MQSRFDVELDRLTARGGAKMKVLLAVSGGIDSMCMAYLYLHSSLPVEVAVAHVNFSLRGEESDGDQDLVEGWCRENGVQFFTKKFDTHAYADEQSISTQMAARDLRYGWFYELMDEHSFEFLSIAHNLNDSVETLFLNMLRGTGLAGISGIRSTNGRIIRPLLGFTRAQIAEFVEKNSIRYREDSTNRESNYARNRIRNEVFPHFAQINPSFLSTINTSMKRFSELGDMMEEQLKAREGDLYSIEDGTLYISIDRLKDEKYRGYWLFKMLSGYGFNDTQISQIEASLEGQSGKTFISPTHILVRDREFLKVYASDGSRQSKVKFRVVPKPADFDPKSAPEGTLYIDAGKVKMPLKCRGWQSADRFKPFGMKGFKKLSDFFVDLKLDVEEKKREMVVTTLDKKGEEQIVCVVGRRIDDRFKVTQRTRKIVIITLFKAR
jgi:tRNA(Ile)-lysidine synthetase, N-terminal domain/tRNA(Ile)-lysidine synthetase, C-terminal domain